MNRKSVLQLMELLIMILVFAISASICVRCFVHADQLSREQERKSSAVLAAQNVAELLKANSGDFEKSAGQLGGSWDETNWRVPLDDSWNVTAQHQRAKFLLEVTKESKTGLPVGTALLRVTDGEKVLAEIRVAWQEGQ